MAARVGIASEEAVSPEEHWDWARRLWSRIDRDKDGKVSPEELNCNEFQEALRSILAPRALGLETGSFGRAEQNVKQLLGHCFRKADADKDGGLSLEEFVAFTRDLRSDLSPEGIAEIVFALFDLDGDWFMDREEFRGVYCFYLGFSPTADDFLAEWSRLDQQGVGRVDKEQFARWLPRARHPCFRQHAGPVLGSQVLPRETRSTSSPATRSSLTKFSSSTWRPAPGLVPRRPEQLQQEGPAWNEHFAKDTSTRNMTFRGNGRMKTYFSRPQSLPELRRFYGTYQGFERSLKRLDTEPPSPHRKPVLSDETTEMLRMPGAERHFPGGTMRNSRGEEMPWRELTPRALKRTLREPGSMLLRIPMGTPQLVTPWTERRDRLAAGSKPGLKPRSVPGEEAALPAPRGREDDSLLSLGKSLTPTEASAASTPKGRAARAGQALTC